VVDSAAGGGGAPPQSFFSRQVTAVGQALSNKTTELIVAGIISVASLLLGIAWASFTSATQRIIITTVANEMSQRNNKLVDPLKISMTEAKGIIVDAVTEELNKANNRFIEPLKNLRKTEIGAITAGSFILTPDNDLFPVYLYMPNSNDGTLAYTVEGSDGDRRYVTLSFPTTRELYRLKTYDEFELKSYLHSEGSNKVALNQLYRLGFQLQGTDPGRVTVTYVARIRPILEEH